MGIGQGGLGLGEHDYYISDDAQNKRVLEAYKQYLKKLFMLTGADEATAEKKMEAVLAIETRIAKHVNKKVDKTEWAFFDPTADDAANYGAIGGVIGHEMSHGFDDQGAQFDKYGNQHNWWTAQDKKNFDARTKVLADWFSSFEVLPGVKVNGKQTLGENIGDNGGLNIAFRACPLSQLRPRQWRPADDRRLVHRLQREEGR